MMLGLWKLKLKFRFIYICADCDKMQEGTTTDVELEGHGRNDIIEKVSMLRNSALHMPVGWMHNGTYHCGCVKR